MSDIADPTSWTDREREFFAHGWNECVKMQPGENGRLRAALKAIDAQSIATTDPAYVAVPAKLIADAIDQQPETMRPIDRQTAET